MRLAKGGQRQFQLEINRNQDLGYYAAVTGRVETNHCLNPVRANLGHEKSFSGFDCNLRAGVGLRETGGRNVMFDVPLAHKILCDESCKFWANI